MAAPHDRHPLQNSMSLLTYKAASAVLGALPEPVVRRGGEWAGWLSYLWADRRRHMADRHMTRVGGASGRDLFRNYGRYWAELLWIDGRKATAIKRSIQAEGLEHVEAARDAGLGAIVALPHVGNWEVAGLVGQDIGVHVVAVAEDLPDSDVTRWFVAKREELALEIIVADGSKDLISDLKGRLEAGQVVALLCDRDVLGTGIEVEFFGETTSVPSGPALLAIRTGVPILPVAAYFKPGRGHHIVVKPPVEVARDGRLRERVQITTQRVVHALEDLIRVAPSQWHIVQPNWPSDRAANSS